ncbi:ABC transporter ATP-binding protein [Patescibacteria group bacterium]|nr:ABC transporter ATP-binding protein [Patescibacteria group bacterium]
MITVNNLNYSIGNFSLRISSLEIADGEYFVLLGPTGSGKTLFIECLCGLIRPNAGKIEIDDRNVTNLPPRLRQIGYVPQDYELFPHMNVEENITFALKIRGMSHKESCKLVQPIVEILSLAPFLKRSTMTLSGGERQKVALARALARRPNLLLLDEPVSALDEQSRQRVCEELRRIQKELSVTTIHVSHNFQEAITVSDQVGILRGGKIVQKGPITELIRKPKNEFVARFFRAENIFEGMAEPCSDGGIINFAGHRINVRKKCQGQVKFIVRPELIKILPFEVKTKNAIPAVLINAYDMGVYKQFEFDAGVRILVYAMPENEGYFKLKEKYSIVFPPDAIHILT